MLTPILIAGPTASGKSALAVALAQQTNGIVINADSMQVYDCWQCLSARPTIEEMQNIPHHLYGHISANTPYSVGAWLRELRPIFEQCNATQKRPIIVGGTGLYFSALTRGLSEIPAIPSQITAQAEALLAQIGREAFYQQLCQIDSRATEIRDPQNPMRLLRAWSVLKSTGRSLFDWNDTTPAPFLPLSQSRAFLLTPPRDWLYTRCEQRFDQMIGQGAIEEVREAQAYLKPQSLAAHTIGTKEISAYLNGHLSLETAIETAKMATRRYAKRQSTWFKNQMRAWKAVPLEHYYDVSIFSGIFLKNLD